MTSWRQLADRRPDGRRDGARPRAGRSAVRLPAADAGRVRRQSRSAERLLRVRRTIPDTSSKTWRDMRASPLDDLHRRGAEVPAQRQPFALERRAEGKAVAGAAALDAGGRCHERRERPDRIAASSCRAAAAVSVLPDPQGRASESAVALVGRTSGLPVVTFMLVLPVGSAADFEGYEGLAAITADMMDEGTGNLSAIDVNAAFARLGAHLETDVSADATVFTVTTLAKFPPQALSLLADCVVRPRLDAADFDRIRQLRLTRLVQIRDMPVGDCRSGLHAGRLRHAPVRPHGAWHGGIAAAADLDTVRDVSLALLPPVERDADCVRRSRRRRIPQMAADAFRPWSDARPDVPDDAGVAAPPARLPVHRLVLVDKPGAAQSEIRIGEVGLAREHARLPPADRAEHDSRRTVRQPHQHEAAAGEGADLRRTERRSISGAGEDRSFCRRACKATEPPRP